MRIEDMNFEPHKGFGIFMITLSAVYTLVFGTIAVVNVYRQLRDPSSLSDVFGWLFTLVITTLCVALLLYVSTLVFRLKFYESGIVIRGLRGRHFVAWNTIREARVSRFKGTVELALKADGRRIPVSIPLSSYKKELTLLAEIRRRLPVAVYVPPDIAASLTDG